jgi:hypothetical protein
MPTLTFYRQARVDGGVRTGIDVDDETVLHHFQPETSESDPALLWYIDLRCKGERLPSEADDARAWFIDKREWFQRELRRIAEQRLEMGFDAELRPYHEELSDGPKGAEVVVYVSAVRRLTARDIASQLRDLADRWEQILHDLAPLSKV